MSAAAIDNRRAMPRPSKEPDTSQFSGRIAARIRAERERIGLSVEELAAKIEGAGYSIAAPTLYHWENGNRRPDLDALPFIAKALRLRLSDFLPPK